MAAGAAVRWALAPDPGGVPPHLLVAAGDGTKGQIKEGYGSTGGQPATCTFSGGGSTGG